MPPNAPWAQAREGPISPTGAASSRRASASCATDEGSWLAEAGLPFLEERRHGLLMVGAEIGQRLVGQACIEDRVSKLAQADVDASLRIADRLHGSGCEAIGKGVYRGIEIGRIHGVVHKPHALGILGQNMIARHQILLCPGIADKLRPDNSSAITCDQPDKHMRVGYSRALDGKYDVAKQRQSRAEPDRMSVELGNHRLFAVEEAENDLLRLNPTALPQRRIVDHLLEPTEGSTGREGATGAGENDDIRSSSTATS